MGWSSIQRSAHLGAGLQRGQHLGLGGVHAELVDHQRLHQAADLAQRPFREPVAHLADGGIEVEYELKRVSLSWWSSGRRACGLRNAVQSALDEGFIIRDPDNGFLKMSGGR